MIGFGANRRGGRLPTFILIALMVVTLVLSYNYWTVSRRNTSLLDELAEVQMQVKRTDGARSRLEKRNSELMLQADAHRKQMDQKDGRFKTLETELKSCETQLKQCADDKVKQQSDVSTQRGEIQKLQEQLKELRQEVLKQEEQLREVRLNRTQLEKKLEYESLQCGQQIAQLKEEYEDKQKKVEAEAAKLKQSLLENQVAGAAKGENAKERHPEVSKKRDSSELKVGKLASDAGMPGIEDGEMGKPELQYALKKPAVTKDVVERGGGAGKKEERAGPGAGPDLKKDDLAARVALPGAASEKRLQQPPAADKAGVHADELGDNKQQLKVPGGGKADDGDKMGVAVPPPPNRAQVLPNPAELQHAKDAPPAPRHRQSRFFDENESPVDPQHGSKLADYNGDDGNVGEYEADKQAELAYNEEEDGDGGEEDVQGELGEEGLSSTTPPPPPHHLDSTLSYPSACPIQTIYGDPFWVQGKPGRQSLPRRPKPVAPFVP
ncbi:hypothetical protein GJAV_G00250870 [Gymnothorax javanicus]|nr:hypothetical protein GJAV_G00250870 [Gymnothorax javanicus]